MPRTTRPLAIGVVWTLALFARESHAAEQLARFIEVANPSASIGYAYDTNLLRLADDVIVADDRSDQYYVVRAGFESQIPVSRQRFELSGEANHSAYDANDDLDHTGGKAAAIWYWAAGDDVTGTLGYKYNRVMRDFANQVRLERSLDLRSENRFLASADFDLRRSWNLSARGDLAETSFSTTQALDVERRGAGMTIGYRSSADNFAGLDVTLVNRQYDTGPDLDEYVVGPKLEWQVTDRTRLDAMLGYAQREAAAPAGTEYGEVTGRLVLDISNEGRQQLRLSVWRELSNLADEVADVALINGVSVEPRWQPSIRLGLELVVRYEDRDFLASGRRDSVYSGGFVADWVVTRNIGVSLGFIAQRRSSSRPLQDYDSNCVELRITASR